MKIRGEIIKKERYDNPHMDREHEIVTLKLWHRAELLTLIVPDYRAKNLQIGRWANVTVEFDPPKRKRRKTK